VLTAVAALLWIAGNVYSPSSKKLTLLKLYTAPAGLIVLDKNVRILIPVEDD
jgi:hypothetical protein